MLIFRCATLFVDVFGWILYVLNATDRNLDLTYTSMAIISKGFKILADNVSFYKTKLPECSFYLMKYELSNPFKAPAFQQQQFLAF